MPAIRLIVGLANPGSRYAGTRHNAGAWWVERLVAREHLNLQARSRFNGRVADYGTPATAWLAIPDTYMNLSGQCVAPLAQFRKLAPEEILIAHDELDLPPGSVRLKQGGGHGGHNGLRDIIDRLGSRDFWRLRVGIGHPGHASAVVGYVLGKPGSEEKRAIDGAIDAAEDEFLTLLNGDMAAAMNRLHQL